MTQHEALAAALFGAAAARHGTDAPVHPLDAHQAAAEALYGEGTRTAAEVAQFGAADVPPLAPVSREVQALRDEMGEVNLEGAFKALNGELVDMFQAANPTAEPADTARAVNEWKAIALDLQLGHDDLSNLASAVKAATLSPIDATARADGARESMEQLRAVYGADANVVLGRTKALVNRDPRVRALLESTGLGSQPRTVLRLAELAQEQFVRGRLK
ncbi:MAG: hypothetical protein ACKVOX_05670 [Rhizobacter sp.]